MEHRQANNEQLRLNRRQRAIRVGTLLSSILIAAILSAPAVFGDAPWDRPSTNGIALWHFDEAGSDGASPNAVSNAPALRLTGAARIDPVQKRHGSGSLSLSGGQAVAEKVPFGGNPVSFELFLDARTLPEPGKEACVFRMHADTAKGEGEVMSLRVDHQGTLKLGYVHQDRRFLSSGQHDAMEFPQRKVVPGRWMHISAHLSYGDADAIIRFMIDGEIIDEGWLGDNRLEAMSATDWNVRLVLGNSPKGDQPFDGWIDEVRVAGEILTPAPVPASLVTIPDPEAKRPLLPPGTSADDLLFYVSFDDTLEPAVVQGKARQTLKLDPLQPLDKSIVDWPPGLKQMPPRFGPGIRGQALGMGGRVIFPATGNILADAGTVSEWFWYRDVLAEIGRIFVLGNGWHFMLSGSHGFFCDPAGLLFPSSGPVPFAIGGVGGTMKQQWNHVALTWRGDRVETFVNGRLENSFLIPGGVKSFMNPWISIGDSWDKYGEQVNSYVDELMIFRRALSAAEVENVFRLGQGREPLPVLSRHSRVEPCVSQGKLTLTIDQNAPGVTPGKNLLARLIDRRGKTVSTTTAARMLDGAAEMVLDIKEVPKGEYTVALSQQATNGVALFTDRHSYQQPEFPWLKAHVGDEDKVLAPWTPVTAGQSTVKVWGREIKLSGLALPAQMLVQGQSLLAEPAYFEITGADGRVQRLGAQPQARLESSSPTRAVYSGGVRTDLVNLGVRNETAYDGCSKVELTLAAGAKPAAIKRLTLVLPIAPEFARYINAKGFGIRSYYLLGALPSPKGRVFGSHIIPLAGGQLQTEADTIKLLNQYEAWDKLRRGNQPVPKEFEGFTTSTRRTTSGTFIPYLWVGTPDGGLCWFADNDQGWTRSDGIETPAIEIVRRAERGIAEVRINFIAAPTKLTGSRRIVFGMIPTPVRPLAADWRKRYWRWPTITGFGYEWTSGRQYKGIGCPGAYVGEPYPIDWDRARWYTQTYVNSGVPYIPGPPQVPYFEFTNVSGAVIPPYMEREWRLMPNAWGVQGGIFPTRSYADWWCYEFLRYRQVASPDGVYLDNVCPQASVQESQGAWRDEHGQLEASYNLWGLRDMFRRIRTVFQDTGSEWPWIQLHMTHCNLINAMGFADILYDGEDFFRPAKEGLDFIDSWSLDMITAIDSPHAWGVPTRFLRFPAGSPEEWDKEYKLGYLNAIRAGVGSLLLVDCYSEPLGGTILDDLARWGVLQQDCGFIGHWRELFKTGDPDVKVAAYQRPDALLIIVQNRSREGAKAAHVVFNPKGLLDFPVDEATVADQETQARQEGGQTLRTPLHPELKCSVRMQGADWVLGVDSIPPRDFRLISISRKKSN